MKPNFKQLLTRLDTLLVKADKLTLKHKLLICLGVWAVPIVAFVLLVFMPKAEEIDNLENRIAGLKTEIARLAAVARELDQHRAEMAAVEERLRVVAQLLPEEREIPTLLTNISILGTASGLDFLLFRPRNEVRQEFYAEIPVDIAVHGPYHNVGVFLDRISKLPRIVTVNNINMGSPSRSGNVMYLNTTFTLMTYRFIEPAPEPPPAPARRSAPRRR